MSNRLKFDSDSENFDLFFQKQIEGIRFNSESGLPKEVIEKLYRKGGDINSVSTSKLSGMEKMYILWKALNNHCYIIIEDEKDGVGLEEYCRIRESVKRNPPEPFNDNGTLHIPFTFIKANKELSQVFSYYNQYCNSLAYKYAIGIKNKTINKIAKWKKETRYLARFLLNYEESKGRVSRNFGLATAELYVLLYLYDEEEKQATPLYKEKLYGVYGAGARQTKLAFVRLRNVGLITKRGTTNTAKYKITPLGIDKVNEFFKKYATNI
jgi:hypothetical protein